MAALTLSIPATAQHYGEDKSVTGEEMENRPLSAVTVGMFTSISCVFGLVWLSSFPPASD